MQFLIKCMEGSAWVSGCESIACIPAGITKYTTLIYNFIKLAVPLLLIITGMITMAKAILESSQEKIKQAQQLLVKRAVAALIVYLLFSLVTWLLNILNSSGSNTAGVISCLNSLFGK